uniref:Uncharacterized protein n=1 Tax=Myotis myotis TaxID=51298 RepID=A0A7J7R7G5_MYOMY|nr:hypothetical protein mMyoMyo1_010878 [Myotis myotis]
METMKGVTFLVLNHLPDLRPSPHQSRQEGGLLPRGGRGASSPGKGSGYMLRLPAQLPGRAQPIPKPKCSGSTGFPKGYMCFEPQMVTLCGIRRQRLREGTWIGAGPTPTGECPCKRRERAAWPQGLAEETAQRRRRHPRRSDVATGRERLEPPATASGIEGADTFSLGFRPPEMRKRRSVVSSHQVLGYSGTSFLKPRSRRLFAK